MLNARSTLGQSLQSFADRRLKRQECEQAMVLVRESLLLSRELGSPHSIAFCLESFAKLAGVQGWTERAAALFGAVEGLREASGVSLSPGERSGLQPSIDASRSSLPQQAWPSAWSAGKAMSLEQATEYALSTVASSPGMATTFAR